VPSRYWVVYPKADKIASIEQRFSIKNSYQGGYRKTNTAYVHPLQTRLYRAHTRRYMHQDILCCDNR